MTKLRHANRLKSSCLGFTLAELMIVVAIVAVIAAIAVPSFLGQSQKTRRTEAKNALSELANKQEIYFLQHNQYSNVVDTTTGLGYGSKYSQTEGYYLLTASACSGGNLQTCFIATATASKDINSAQFDDDPDCRTMSITNKGVTSSTNSGGADSTTTCW